MKARLELGNAGFRLKPEMFVDVLMQMGGARRLMVPTEAVLDSGVPCARTDAQTNSAMTVGCIRT